MAESRTWTWQVPALIGEDEDEDEAEDNGVTTLRLSLATKGISIDRRLSLPTHVGGGWGSSSRFAEREICVKLVKLRQALQDAREEFLELRQEASDLQEYSSAKLGRVTRYLGVLADKTRKHDQTTLEYEARVSSLRKEKSLHFNELISAKGNVRVLVRVRPKLKSEAHCCISLPDERTVHISNDARSVEFQFNQVYGPQVSQAQFFQDIQPLVQSAIDGYNVCIFACGPKASGKTYTMEGPEHDRGMYFRTFEELFDLSNGESTPTSKFSFYVTVLEICDEQIEDLLKEVPSDLKPQNMVEMECSGPFVQCRVENPLDFARVFKAAVQKQSFTDARPKTLSSPCLAVTFHVHYANVSTGEKHYNKISLLDVPGAEKKMNSNGISNSFSSLVKVVSSLVWKRNPVPFDESKCTHILSDSLGGDSKTVVVLHINPDDAALEETKCWLRAAKLCSDDASRTLQNKIFQEQNKELKLEIEKLKVALQESKEMHQQPVKGSDELADRSRFERNQIVQLKTQVVQFAKIDREQKAELASRASRILALEDQVQELSQRLQGFRSGNFEPSAYVAAEQMGEELSKRDELIERLHQENEKLFQRLTERSTFSPRVPRLEHTRTMDNSNLTGSLNTKPSKRSTSPQKRSSGGSDPGFSTALQLQTTGVDKPKTTPAGQYLTTALTAFEPDHYNGPAAISDAANKLLMLVLAAVIKAGASREHDMLEEIREAVFAFIRKLEPRKVMDTMLVSRVRILYVRSLLAKSPELQALKVPPVDQFLKKSGSRSSRASSSGSSPTRSPVSAHSLPRKELVVEDEQGKPLRINLKPERTSRLSSIVLRLRGIDQETWRQQLTEAKLRELNEEARKYAVGNKKLAALFVHTPAGELQRRIRNWLADSFDFLSLPSGESAGQLELLSTAIMDGWMAGLGIPTRPSADSLGQLLSDYTKQVYMSQLQSLKDIAGTLATEEAEDLAQVSKIRSALEAIDLKRRKILQQMRHDVALLTKEEGGSPLRCPSTASEEARVASLISLEDIINQAEEIRREAPQKASLPSKKKFMLARLTALGEQTSALLSIDHTCAQKFIKQARKAVESASSASAMAEEKSSRKRISDETTSGSGGLGGGGSGDDVVQWSVLQFNNGTDAPFIIKCGANSMMQLVVKAQESTGESKSVVPSPSVLSGLSLEEIKSVLSPLPEAFRQLAVGRTADGTRARYARLYKTLAVRVPSLWSAVSDAEGLSDGPIGRSRGSDLDSYY